VVGQGQVSAAADIRPPGPNGCSQSGAALDQQLRIGARGCLGEAELLLKGLGTAADPAKVRERLEKSCGLRPAPGCEALSDALLSDAGGPADRSKAIFVRRYACLVLNQASACAWIADGGHASSIEDGIVLVGAERFAQAKPLLQGACDARHLRGCEALAIVTANTGERFEAVRSAVRRACDVGSKEACDSGK
jgi:hypothetical protein